MPRDFDVSNTSQSMTPFLEGAVMALRQGRQTIKLSDGLAFGFSDDRAADKENQDRLAIAYCLDQNQSGSPWLFAGICDGVGGEAHGDLAATYALSQIISYLCAAQRQTPEQRLLAAISHAHKHVQQRLNKRSATTFAGILITAKSGVVIGSVGDSRIYSLGETESTKLTEDDTLAEMLHRRADVTDTEVRSALSELQSRWQHSLGQAIGSDLPLQPQVTQWPGALKSDGCLLCTDGVWKPIESILNVVVSSANDDRTDLARRLLALTDLLGATDNATAIVLPNIEDLLRWLRGSHPEHERGILHIVLPNESIAAPWQLLAPKSIAPATVAEKAPVAKKPVQKDRLNRGKVSRPAAAAAKRSKPTIPDLQLSIVEGSIDDVRVPSPPLPKDK